LDPDDDSPRFVSLDIGPSSCNTTGNDRSGEPENPVSNWNVEADYGTFFSPKAIEDRCHDASERRMRDLNHCRTVSIG